jgi:calcineurin-like phosphoesterase family protein
VTLILAVADEIDETLYGGKLLRLRPDLVVSCGDLPFEYLEHLVSRLDVPLLYVPGNHDPNLQAADPTWTTLRPDRPAPGPEGCINADGRIIDAAGLRVAGLGGSIRYKPGANQYTQAQMRWRALSLEVRIRLKRRRARKLDVLLTHAPPFGWGPGEDAAHVGFAAFTRIVQDLSPRLLIHGHVHPFGRAQAPGRLGATQIVNAVPSRLVEI